MLANLDIQVITVPALRLDIEVDRCNLAETVDRLRPRLLILDPFVRLHRIDENASGEVAPLLAYLRELQRRYGVAVLVVHHARKGGACVRPARPCAAPPVPRLGRQQPLSASRRRGADLDRRGWRGSIVPAARRRAGPERPGPRPGSGRAGRPSPSIRPRSTSASSAALAEPRGPLPFADLRADAGPGRHPPRARPPARRRRPHRQDGRRLPSRRTLISSSPSPFPFPASLQRVGIETETPDCEAAFPSSTQLPWSGPRGPGWPFSLFAGPPFPGPGLRSGLASRAGRSRTRASAPDRACP